MDSCERINAHGPPVLTDRPSQLFESKRLPCDVLEQQDRSMLIKLKEKLTFDTTI